MFDIHHGVISPSALTSVIARPRHGTVENLLLGKVSVDPAGDQELRLDYIDNGKGITTSAQPLIFDSAESAFISSPVPTSREGRVTGSGSRGGGTCRCPSCTFSSISASDDDGTAIIGLQIGVGSVSVAVGSVTS